MNVKFVTLGCKTNQYETNAMEQSFKNAGYEINDKKKPDIYVVNTCSVTSVAERKSRQMIRRAKELNENAIVVVCGCYSQVAKNEIEKIDDVDIILGINEKNRIVEIVEEFIKKENTNNKFSTNKYNENKINTIKNNIIENNAIKPKNIENIQKNEINLSKKINDNIIEKNQEKIIEVSDVSKDRNFEDFGATTYTELTRAYIKIQDGCDRFCSYCIIPYARGRVRSREPESIINEIKKCAQNGIKEVVITGIHIASYGKDFSEEQGLEFRKEFSDPKNQSVNFVKEKNANFTNNIEKNEKINDNTAIENENKNSLKNKIDKKDDLHFGYFRLIDLLEEINKIEGIKRIRLGSIEPKLINAEFVERLSKLNKICHHFHLSLQSGCDATLKRMNRRYTAEEFGESAKLLRKNFENVHLTTDIIVGFPGENEAEFNTTYEFLKKIKFYKTHIFKYSVRSGTVAAIMPNQIDGKIKEERSKKLIELSNENELSYNKSYIGKEIEVLVEEKEDGYYKGHTDNYILAKIKCKDEDNNNIKNSTDNEIQINTNKCDNLINKVIKAKVVSATSEFVECDGN